MPGASQNSFIPKRGPVKQVKRAVRKQIYLLTLLAYIAFFASIIAAGAVFAYQQYVQSQLADAILEFNNTANTFSESDLRRVTVLESRMRQAQFAVGRQFSIAKLLERIEFATAVSSRINSLTITRTSTADILANRNVTTELADAQFFNVQADLSTDSYDSVIFQRNTFAGLEEVPVLSVTNVTRSFQDVAVTTALNQSATNPQDPLEQTTYSLAMVFAAESFRSNPADAASKTQQMSQPTQSPAIIQSQNEADFTSVEDEFSEEIE